MERIFVTNRRGTGDRRSEEEVGIIEKIGGNLAEDEKEEIRLEEEEGSEESEDIFGAE